MLRFGDKALALNQLNSSYVRVCVRLQLDWPRLTACHFFFLHTPVSTLFLLFSCALFTPALLCRVSVTTSLRKKYRTLCCMHERRVFACLCARAHAIRSRGVGVGVRANAYDATIQRINCHAHSMSHQYTKQHVKRHLFSATFTYTLNTKLQYNNL